jgi:hypothetical protein
MPRSQSSLSPGGRDFAIGKRSRAGSPRSTPSSRRALVSDAVDLNGVGDAVVAFNTGARNVNIAVPQFGIWFLVDSLHVCVAKLHPFLSRSPTPFRHISDSPPIFSLRRSCASRIVHPSLALCVRARPGFFSHRSPRSRGLRIGIEIKYRCLPAFLRWP